MQKKLYKYKIIDVFKDKRITTVASSWVYYFLTALLPLVFLLVSAFSLFNVNLMQEIVFRLPEEFRLAGETIFLTAQNAGSGATIFFVFSVVFSGSTLFNQMSKDGDYLYGENSNKRYGIFRRVFSILALCVLFLIFLSSAFLFTFQNLIIQNLHLGDSESRVLYILGCFLVVSISYFVIVLLNKFISPVKRNFFDLAVGSLVSLFIIILGTLGFTVYLRLFSNFNAFYGSLVGIIVFLIWAYIVMLGLVIGTAFNVKRYKNTLV